MFSITDIAEFRRENKIKSRLHAIANARQAALSLEEEREGTRDDELRREQLQHERKRLEERMFDIDAELQEINDALRAPQVNHD